METIAMTSKKWRVLRDAHNSFCKESIEDILGSINQISNGDYYMLNYLDKKIIIDDSSSSILCGHPKEIADKEGFDFFKRILNLEEQDWLNQVNRSAYKFFFNYDKVKRKKLKIFYDLTVKTVNGEEYALHHKTTPFKLCKNGNMWLGLCRTTIAVDGAKKESAYIVDTLDGKKYDFIDGNFALSLSEALTSMEKQILTMMAKGINTTQISHSLSISETAFNRHKRKMFDKLGVDRSTSAVYKAHVEGLI